MQMKSLKKPDLPPLLSVKSPQFHFSRFCHSKEFKPSDFLWGVPKNATYVAFLQVSALVQLEVAYAGIVDPRYTLDLDSDGFCSYVFFAVSESSWWLNQLIWQNILVELDHFPKDPGVEKSKNMWVATNQELVP